MASVFSAFPIPQRPEYSGNLGSADSDGNEVPVPRRPPSPSHGVFFVLGFFISCFSFGLTGLSIWAGVAESRNGALTFIIRQEQTACLPA